MFNIHDAKIRARNRISCSCINICTHAHEHISKLIRFARRTTGTKNHTKRYWYVQFLRALALNSQYHTKAHNNAEFQSETLNWTLPRFVETRTEFCTWQFYFARHYIFFHAWFNAIYFFGYIREIRTYCYFLFFFFSKFASFPCG